MTSFSTFTSETLNRIIEHQSIPVAEDSPKKAQLVEHLNTFVAELGFSIFSSELKKDELETAAAFLKLDTSDVKKPTKVYLKKRLGEKAVELGLDKFFAKFADNSELISAFADTCGLDEAEDEEAGKKRAKEISREVESVGNEALFERLDTPFLKELVEEAKLKVDKADRSRYVEALVTGKNVKGTKNDALAKAQKKLSKEAEAAANKDKPSIKKGVSYQGIFQHYVRQEVFDWAKENGLKTSGNKPTLIKRIIAFLNGDTENTLAQPKEKKEKKEKAAPKSPKKGKKASEKKEEKETKKAKKEDKKEEKEASDDEEKKEKKTKESKKKN